MKAILSSILSITTAFLASLCCIFPLVLAALPAGLGFKIAQYRWHLLGLSFLILGYGYYDQFLRKCSCDRKKLIINRTLLIISTLLLVGISVYMLIQEM